MAVDIVEQRSHAGDLVQKAVVSSVAKTEWLDVWQKLVVEAELNQVAAIEAALLRDGDTSLVARGEGDVKVVRSDVGNLAGCVLDAQNNIIIADESGEVHKVTPAGMAERLPFRFGRACGVAIDGDGSIIVADGQVKHIKSGSATTIGMHDAMFVAVDAQGNLYSCSENDQSIYKMSRGSSTWTPIFMMHPVSRPFGMSYHPKFNALLVANAGAHNVGVYFLKDQSVAFIGTGEPGHADGAVAQAQFNCPCGAAPAIDGGILVVDFENGSLRHVTADLKTVTTHEGSRHAFSGPIGVVQDVEGKIFISEEQGRRLWCVTGWMQRLRGKSSKSKSSSATSDENEASMDFASQAPVLSHDCIWSALAPFRHKVKAFGKAQGAKDADKVSKAQAAGLICGRLKELKVEQKNDAIALDAAVEELERELQPLMSRFDGWLTAPAFVSSLRPESRQRWRGPCGSDGGSYFNGRLQQPVPGSQHSFRGPVGSDGGVHSNGHLQQSVPGSPHSFQATVDLTSGNEDDAVLEELREAVHNLDAEISQDGGPTGGWFQPEHHRFVRFFRWFRHHPLPSICECLAERLTDIPYADIEAHVNWFFKFEQQQAHRRTLLAKWRDRKSQLDRQALEAHELLVEEQRRRREGLQRSRSEILRAQVKDWQCTQSQLKKQASVERLRSERQQSESDKAKKRKEQRRHEAKKIAVDKFRCQRKAAQKEEEEALVAEQSSAPLTPDVKHRISHRNDEMLRKRREATQTNPYLRRSQSQPAKKSPRDRIYERVENNPYASTQCCRQHVAARVWGEPKTELAGACLLQVDPDSSCLACLWEAGMQRAFEQQLGFGAVPAEHLGGGCCLEALPS